MAVHTSDLSTGGAYANDPATRRLLAADSIANYLLGAPLLIAPVWSAKLLGLPKAGERFYPQVLGGVLAGIATALAIERSRRPGAPVSLGVPGAIAINAAGGAAVALWLRTGAARALPMRGRAVLRTVEAVVLGIGALEAVNHWYRGAPETRAAPARKSSTDAAKAAGSSIHGK